MWIRNRHDDVARRVGVVPVVGARRAVRDDDAVGRSRHRRRDAEVDARGVELGRSHDVVEQRRVLADGADRREF